MSNTFAMIMKCFNSIDLIFNILKKSKKISKSFKKTGDNLLMCIFRVTQTMMKILCVCMCVCVCLGSGTVGKSYCKSTKFVHLNNYKFARASINLKGKKLI